jgi:Holliday junction DNA helicase RuvB
MARQRLVTPTEQSQDEGGLEQESRNTLRPTQLEQFIGQPTLKDRLGIAIEACTARSEPMEHVLLHGPPGLGKTTLAHVIAHEMGTRAYVTSGPALTKGTDLVGTLTRMGANDVLFIDEIHRLPAAVEEYIFPAMEDYKIDFTLDSGMHAKVITYRLRPFTLIGATTRAGLLSGPLRSRFGITHHLEYYDDGDLLKIIRRATSILSIPAIADESMEAIARRSRGTPRIALRLLRRVRDFAQVRSKGVISTASVEEALALEGIDDKGVDHLDRTYLRTLRDTYEGGPAGIEAIAASMGEDVGTLEDTVEPFLLQAGLVSRTRQGRKLTAAGRTHLDIADCSSDG